MALGANLSYVPSLAGSIYMLKAIAELGTPSLGGRHRGTTTLRNQICEKTGSDTAPADDTAADIPLALGDYCLHFLANGTFDAVYQAIDGDLVTLCKWRKLAAT